MRPGTAPVQYSAGLDECSLRAEGRNCSASLAAAAAAENGCSRPRTRYRCVVGDMEIALGMREGTGSPGKGYRQGYAAFGTGILGVVVGRSLE